LEQSKLNVDQKQVSFKRREMPSESSQHIREESQIGGGAKGEIMVLGGGQRQHWMVVSIQASVSG